MGIFLGVLFFLISFFMICAILLQEGKGGGLAAMSGAVTDSVMGTRNPLRRITAYSFVIFLLVSVAISYHQSREANQETNMGLVTPPTTVDQVIPVTPGLDGAPAAAPANSTNAPASAAPTAPAVPAAPNAAPAQTPAPAPAQ